MYHINDIAKICGVSTQTIRYYEKEKLMPSPKREEQSHYRVYDENDITRLLNIVQLRSLGFGISEIRKYINNSFTKEQKIHNLRNIIDICNMQIALIQGVLSENDSPDVVVRECYGFYGITRLIDIGEPAEITSHFNDMIEYAKRRHITLQQSMGYMVTHDYEKGKVILTLPVQPTEDECVSYYPKSKIVSSHYNGSIENYGQVIDCMRAFSKKLGYKIAVNPRERYLLPINPVNYHCVVEFQFEIIE